MNSNSDSTHKKLPENIYFFGVPNILPEPDPSRLWYIGIYEKNIDINLAGDGTPYIITLFIALAYPLFCPLYH